MDGFRLWLMLLESGRFDRDGFNALFRDQLARLLPRVTDERRRASLERMRGTDFVAYILAALRNAGLGDDRDREEAAHDVVVQLLVQPGQLFSGYDPDRSGPMEARFGLSVRNAVLNVVRSLRRREPMSRAVGGTGGGSRCRGPWAAPASRPCRIEDVVATTRCWPRS